MERLVEAILKVDGYKTYHCPKGCDGGIDLLAGRGPLGFDEPRLAVQVKSGGVQDHDAILGLQGAMSSMGVERGLFVSWDGFQPSALKEQKSLFFKIRLWNDKDLIAAVLERYDQLPEEIQAELPLKRIWVVVPEED